MVACLAFACAALGQAPPADTGEVGAPSSPTTPPDQLAEPLPVEGDRVSAGAGVASNGVALSANLIWAQSERGALLMSEGVRAEYQGTTITADRCDIDTDAQIAYFYPYVVLEREGERIVGERCEFRFDDHTWTIWNATAELSPRFFSNWTSDIAYLHAEEIEGDDDRATLHDAYLTTSPRARIERETDTGLLKKQKDPQWMLRCDRIRVERRGRYVVLSPVTVYIAKVPIFWLPGLGISRSFLRSARYVPEVGQNASEGWYFRWAYPYYRDNMLRVGFTQNQGETYGLDYRRRGDTTSYGVVANYRTKTRSFTGSANLDTRVAGGSLSASYELARASALLSTFSTTENAQFSYSLSRGAHSINLNANQNATTTTQRRTNSSANADYRWSLDDATEFQASAQYSSVDTTPSGATDPDALVANEELQTTLRLSSRQSWADLQLLQEQRVDPDGDTYTDDDLYGYTERLPELELRTDLRRLGLAVPKWAANITASAGRLHEASTETRLWRYAVDADVRRDPIDWGTTRLDLSGGYKQRYYQGDTAIYSLGGRANLTTEWSEQLRTTFLYNYMTTAGYSPLRSDFMSRYQTASGSIQWTSTGPRVRQNASLDTSYDVRLSRWADLRLAYGWRGSAGNSITLSTSYNLEGGGFRQASIAYNTRRRGVYDWQLSTGYDFGSSQFTTVRSTLDWMIKDDSWRVRWTAGYSPARSKLDQNNIQLIHYTGAFTYALGYNSQRRDFRLSISVRGLPNLVSEGFGVGSHGEIVTPTTGGGSYF